VALHARRQMLAKKTRNYELVLQGVRQVVSEFDGTAVERLPQPCGVTLGLSPA
jgi:hypothetical protein